MNTPRDIIFFHSGSVGDFLMYLFLAELFYRANPVVRISIVMPRNTSFLRGFLGSYPYVSILEISKWKPWRLLPLFFRSKSITVIINPTVGRIPLRAKLLGWFLSRRGGTLVGFKDKGPLCGLYSKLLFYDIHKPYHETLIDIVRAFGIEPPLFTPRLAIQSDSDELAERGLKPHRYVVIHPGALAPERSFSPDAVLAMAEAIRVKKPDMDIVVSGGPGDKKLLEEIKTRDPRVILAMALPALQISAIIKEARLYIGVDTGISHLACFLGTKSIVVAHSGTAVNWLPWYATQTTVLYRLREEKTVRQDLSYLLECRMGGKPFGPVPADAMVGALLAALT